MSSNSTKNAARRTERLAAGHSVGCSRYAHHLCGGGDCACACHSSSAPYRPRRRIAYGGSPLPDVATVERLVLHGFTAEEIADQLGVTRDAITRVTRDHLPRWAVPLGRQVRTARRHLRAYVDGENDESCIAVRRCAACGLSFRLASNTSACDATREWTCGDRCRRLYMALRLHLPGARESHRIANARVMLRSDDPVTRAHAARVLAGTTRYHGRWLIRGSRAWDAACEARALRFPIFDALPAPIRAQIAVA